MSIRRAFSLVVVVGLLAHGVAAQNPCNPCNPCSPKNACNPCNPCGGANPCGGKAMAVNPCAAKMGTVFHVSDPMGRNSVTFTSEAPLEDIIGTTSDVQGYLVFDPKHPGKGGMGEFVVPVASLVTGIPLRDEHLRSAAWLDAGRYPEIRFHIDGARSVRMVNETRTAQTWNMKLHGTLTLHGKTQPMGATARVTYMRESDQTRQKMPGDLLAARATLEVPLKDFGVTGPPGAGIVGSKVSESIEITVRLLGSTHQMAGANPCGGNPCNPCGGNPCNPCGGKNPCNPYARSANPCNPCGGR